MEQYEVVIGMETHAELLTKTKQFCSCANEALAEPNTNVCPVCLGLPGALPVVNEYNVDLSLRSVIALNCHINQHNFFERKNYFYPDLTKAYQLTQAKLPIGVDGHIDLEISDDKSTFTRRVRIHDIHMEEDTGKSTHGEEAGDPDSSLVDYNRSSVPLLEIVTQPDMRSVEEAEAYMSALRQILLYLEISDCKMEQGRLRFEPSVSLRPVGQEEYGTRVEIKNLNSMRAVRDALNAEIARQKKVLSAGGEVQQQTMLWDEASGTTQPMRSKEFAADYRYFPDPDLPPLYLDDAFIERVRGDMAELPQTRKERFINELKLSEYEAGVLTAAREIADYYEAALQDYDNPKTISNWVSNELLGRLNAESQNITESKVSPTQLRDLVKLIDAGTISGKIAKDIFDEMFQSGRDAKEIVEEKGLTQVSDTDELKAICQSVIDNNQKAVQDYLGGKQKSFGALVGGVMKATKGRANPGVANKLLKEILEEMQ